MLATVLDASTTPAGSDAMGPILSGYVKLSAHLQPMRTGIKQLSHYCGIRLGEICDDGCHTKPQIPTKGFVLLLLRSERAVPFRSPGVQNVMTPALFVGLVLEPHASEPNTFRRVGVFNHPCDEYSTPERFGCIPRIRRFQRQQFRAAGSHDHLILHSSSCPSRS